MTKYIESNLHFYHCYRTDRSVMPNTKRGVCIEVATRLANIVNQFHDDDVPDGLLFAMVRLQNDLLLEVVNANSKREIEPDDIMPLDGSAEDGS